MSCGMKKTIIQIYEVQNPEEAVALVALGVEHIGSVLLDSTQVRNTTIRETVRAIQRAGAKSGLIPLFQDRETIFQALDYYQPDFIHFCDALSPFPENQSAVTRECDALLSLQTAVKKRFPRLAVMRSLSVPQAGVAQADEIQKNILHFAETFAETSDFFLIDTLIGSPGNHAAQPVEGYVGITGEVCDWLIAGAIVEASPVPVILAGGISAGNVFDAVIRVKPAGIDSCTRTNALDEQGRPLRFKKNMDKVRKLIGEVRRADAFLRESENHAFKPSPS